MHILVASDSHGRTSNLFDMLRRSSTPRFPADALIFLGDGLRDLQYLRDEGIPLFPVVGNCDLSVFDAPREELLNFEGFRIFFAHGDRFSVKSGVERMVAYAAAKNADIVLYGHTHLADERYFHAGETVGGTVLKKPIYVMNPGSIGESRGGFGCGYGVLALGNGAVLWNRVTL